MKKTTKKKEIKKVEEIKKEYVYPLPSLQQMLTATREKLNKDYSRISKRQSKEEFGSPEWTRLNQTLNIIRIELEQRALGK